MNRLILCLLGLAALGAPAVAIAQDHSDITGTWVMTVATPQGKNDANVTFTQSGEKVTGEVTTPLGKANFSGTLIKNQLAISYSISLQGQPLEFKVSGTVDKDNETMAGTLEFGGIGQTPWSARRKPVVAAAAPDSAPAVTAPVGSLTDVTGRWDVVLTMPQGSVPLAAALKQDGESVTGSISSPLGEQPVAGTMVGTTLRLEFKIAAPQGDMVVSMIGELSPTGLTGKSSVAGLGESNWVGKRVQ